VERSPSRALGDALSSPATYTEKNGVRIWDASAADGLPMMIREHVKQNDFDRRLAARSTERKFKA
jgi:hypothetical protein